MIPQSIRKVLLKEWDIHITDIHSVSGGCINQTVVLSTDKGSYFLKVNPDVPQDFFIRESEGLGALRSAGTGLIVPEVIAADAPRADQPGYLLMEYVPTASRGEAFDFGSRLARLHQQTRKQFGFDHDNYIGRLPQSNQRMDDWIDFFCAQRIEPQLRQAIDTGKIDAQWHVHWDRLAGRLDQLIPDCAPSLLHGDLWSGNYMFHTDGRAVLIDPAVYYGHPEMDLAFSKLFGGFDAAFYQGYEEINPLEPGFSKRMDIHNLYPLLVHVNLFGGHYNYSVTNILSRF
jgi:fructosamine-3-kinase